MDLAALARDPGTPAPELAAAVHACADGTALPVLLLLTHHADPQVRQAVAAKLPLLAGRPVPGAVIETLIRLTRDDSEDVRDWACFALGTQLADVDAEPLRDALAARLEDGDDEARCEALVGLARRADPRALPAVRDALQREHVWLLEVEAAGALGDPALHTLVRAHLDGWAQGDVPRVCAALRLTDPDGVGDDLLDGLAAWYRRGAPADDEDGLFWWRIAALLLDLAEHRAVELADAVRRRLDGHASAVAALCASSLGQDAAAYGWR